MNLYKDEVFMYDTHIKLWNDLTCETKTIDNFWCYKVLKNIERFFNTENLSTKRYLAKQSRLFIKYANGEI